MYKIGVKLRSIRAIRKLNQTEFGLLFGMSRPTYAQYEHDVKAVDREVLYKMAKALNTTEEDLIGDTPAEKLTSVPKNDEQDSPAIDALRNLTDLVEYQRKEIKSLKKQLDDCKRQDANV